MENLYKLPVIYGTACYKNNQCAICYVDEKGKTHLVNKKNKMQIIKHNIFFVRGLEYLIFGLWYFFANLICVNLSDYILLFSAKVQPLVKKGSETQVKN